MAAVPAAAIHPSNMRGIQLPFRELTAPTGLSNHAKGTGRKSKACHSARCLDALLQGAMAIEAERRDEIPF